MADRGNLDVLKELQRLQDDYNKQLASNLDLDAKMRIQEEAIANEKRLQAEQERLITESKKEASVITNQEKKELDNILKTQRDITKEVKNEYNNRKLALGIAKELGNQLKLGWQYLQQSDKVIRQTILNLGMSGNKAELMRASFEQSAGFVARLGGNLEDIQTIMQGYADETGRARVLTSEMVKDITLIGKGTGIGIEQATRLGAQFELMGFDAKTTMEYVQGVVDTTERMGVNTTKVLKNISDNFKKLNTFTFQQGSKGFAQMAQYAEKMKISMDDALNSAKIAKGLEGAIDLTAQLQVMGGEFAKTDPFEMLFLSRNDPAKFTEKIADMTKGVVSFRKMADGTFEKFISPADRDRLAAVAKSLGMEESSLTEIAQRTADIQLMRKQMVGTGLSAKDKELVEGMAVFNKQTGKFALQIGSVSKDLSNINAGDLKVLETQKKTLEQRAKDSQTFEETFKATVMSLKAALLPILKGINVVLVKLQPIADWMSKLAGTGWGGVAAAGGILLSAGMLWKGLTFSLGKIANNWASGGGVKGFFGGAMGGKRNSIPEPTGSISGQRRGIGEGAAAKGQGMKALGKGVGIGAAAVGIGEGINLAATGISKLADSMSKLDKTKIWALPVTIGALSLSFFALAPAITAAGSAGTVGAVGLLALGAAVVGIGFGINLATKGIGKMAEGLGTMFEKSKGAGKDMLMVAGSIAAIAGSLALFSNPLSALGIGAFAAVMGTVIAGSIATATVAKNIERMGLAMKGSKDDWIAVQNAVSTISKANIKGGGALSELANALKNPLKVEFAQKEVAIVSNISLNIDGQKFMQKVYNPSIAAVRTNEVKSGK